MCNSCVATFHVFKVALLHVRTNFVTGCSPKFSATGGSKLERQFLGTSFELSQVIIRKGMFGKPY